MQATIKVYSKSKQTRKDEAGAKHTSFATRTIDTLTYEVSDSLPIAKKLAQISHFITQAIGARYKAFLGAGKTLPSKLFFSTEIDGKVYSSENSLVRANMVNLVSVAKKDVTDKDGNLKDGKAIIQSVANIQKQAIRLSVEYLTDIARIAKECEGYGFPKAEAVKPSTMTVTGTGELSTEEEPVSSEVKPS